jgi:hypothetical protein
MSSRKRSSDRDSTNNEIQADTPDATAVAEAPQGEASDDSPGFAERVGQKQRTPLPDPFGLATDHIAGVKLFEGRQDRQMAIMFGEGRAEDKPSQEVIDALKGAGYRWKPADRIWAHPIRYESARSTRIDAKRLYDEICGMIRQEKGLGASQDLPF